MKRSTLTGLSFLIVAVNLLTFKTALADMTDCHEPEATAGWQALLDKNPGDHDLIILYNLRLSLCKQVEEDALPLETASERFEAARQRVIEKWKSHNSRRQEEQPGAG